MSPNEHTSPKDVNKQVAEALASADGWWISDVLRVFGFLVDDFGFRISSVEVHFRGDHVTFSSSVFDFVVEFEPEPEILRAEFWSVARYQAGSRQAAIRVWNLLGSRDASHDYLPKRDRYADVRTWSLETMAGWAAGLKQYAPDVLAGSATADLPWTE